MTDAPDFDKWVIYHSHGDWSALYIDGKLVKRGDTYLIWEDICDRLGIYEVHSNDFLDGNDAYQTIAEVVAARSKRLHTESEISRLRKHAEEMIRLAAEMEETLP